MAGETRKSTLSPFSNLKIASHEFLRGLERQPCPNCCASRKYYCYVCYITVGVNRSLIPTIKLPIKVDIIKHKGELVGKSTATHARILAPEDVTIHVYPAVPDFKDERKVIIVFPAKDAISLKTLGEIHNTGSMHLPESAGSDLFDRVVFIDSTWQQCHKIIADEKLVGFQKVKLENAMTHFWRPQRNKPDTCLATIEAIYYFFKEYEEYILWREYDGKYDNLLFFFAFQYNLIQEEQAKKLKARDFTKQT
ncbi:tRNA-uridine aminocarboxypropyltransferase 1-like isoform X1 [Acropora muricata]|uniref:tRNA-uridine aminocarboxypropyltransferase 1-like isoform X1 n=1 Tax=Acropora muricata TaxID=159855 RepID=UPI0034E5AC0C